MLSIDDSSSSAQGLMLWVSIKLKIALVRSNMKIVGLSALSAVAAAMRVAMGPQILAVNTARPGANGDSLMVSAHAVRDRTGQFTYRRYHQPG